ncbi:hypothetical protein [Paenibacillus sp. J2TS4]|uniref:hypothetical protein n=1 Tax=Paenibacillus sp. J2TS4 TaxID=2807194 RepID=UPI001AFFB375|nr:hypothetical protein [Paenibacillus sp. J2TS4]GIP33693.1 hypothetical protein J2TS4_29030 [Paenibacillus sp. J2TS4]
MKGFKNVIYLSLALGMLMYAVPQLEIGGGWTLPTVFSIVWIGFALLIIGAQLHDILRVDEETRKELTAIKQMKRWKLQQRLQGKGKLLQMRK